MTDPWNSSLPYEPFMGRWSRKIAPIFLNWLNPSDGLRWLDVGCGTGALSELIASQTRPEEVLGIDPSEAFISHGNHVAQGNPHLRFKVAGAEKIPAVDQYFDIAVSALVLNFLSDPVAGLREMSRVVRQEGNVALYVWDYAEGMQMLRRFWDAAINLDTNARPLDEAVRFPLCRPETLESVFVEAGLTVKEVRALEAPTIFEDFDDYWRPFLGGVGPAPGYVASLNPDQRSEMEFSLRSNLRARPDGSIPLMARAWAVRAVKQDGR